MIYARPEYYDDFACTAGACRHSCCIGWEIDIDPGSLEHYRHIGGETGERLRANIDWEAGSFILTENERCPFLNAEGLCELILAEGEDILCGICSMHPRYVNYMSEREELGLGLCCEEAARLILNREVPFSIIEEGDGGYTVDEDVLMDIRDAAFELINEGSKAVDIMHELPALTGGEVPERSMADWARFYLGLERLDEAWTDVLRSLKAEPEDFIAAHERETRNLLAYFVYRHLFTSLEDGDVQTKLSFAVLSTRIIMAAAQQAGISIEEAARMYSSEIEYSDENPQRIFEEFC